MNCLRVARPCLSALCRIRIRPAASYLIASHYSTTQSSPKDKSYVLPSKYANIVRQLLRRFVPQYQAQEVGLRIYQKSCTNPPSFDAFWIGHCQLPDTFQTWFSVRSLYVWMLMVRIRADTNAKHYNQALVDVFFQDAEKKIRQTGVKSSRIVNDTLKDMVGSFKGTVMALDEGFAGSDAVLAAAVWRNLATRDEDVGGVERVTAYVRAQLRRLDMVEIEKLVAGEFVFDPIDF